MEVEALPGTGYECNSYLIKDQIWVLVDIGTRDNIETLMDAIEKEEGTDKVKKIVLTHTHYDHAGGAAEVARRLGAEILVHPSEGKRISSGDFSITLGRMFGGEIEPFKWSPIDEGSVVDIGEAKLKIMHLPGHSEGSIALWDPKSRSLFCGDTIFADGMIGRYDLPSGDFESLKDSIRRISSLNVADLYPGHGGAVIGEGAEHVSLSLESVRSGI